MKRILVVILVATLAATTVIASPAFAAGTLAPIRTMPWPTLADPDTNLNGMTVLDGDLYVLNRYSGGGRIHRLSTADGSLLSSLPAITGYNPGVDLASDGTHLYLAEETTGGVHIHQLDPTTGADQQVIVPTGISITGGLGGLAFAGGQLHLVVATVECEGVSIVHLDLTTGAASGCLNVDSFGIDPRELDQAGSNLLYGSTDGSGGPFLVRTLDGSDTVVEVTELTTSAPLNLRGLACGDDELYGSDRSSQVINVYAFSACDEAPGEPQTVTLPAAADANVRSGQDHRNYGAGALMRVQASGSNRALVRFDHAAMAAAVAGGVVVSATLRLTIVDNGDNWGTSGRTIDVHRLLSDWTEGDGTESDRGDGLGATWACATDSVIQNQVKNCSGETAWTMGQPGNPSAHPWTQQPTDTRSITNGQAGVVEFDVTADVVAFLSGSASDNGWIVKRTDEGSNGMVSFGTRESTTPELVVTYVPAL